MYCKIEIRFHIYGIQQVKSVIIGLKFVFSDFFPLQIKLLLFHKSSLKNWMPLHCLKKGFERNRRIARLFPAIEKGEKSALISIVSIQQYPVTKFSFKEKRLNLIISFNFSNKSSRTFIQKSTDQRPFHFFRFGTQNRFACL